MKVGDLALYYHTGTERRVVGVARVASNPMPDRTAAQGEDWYAVDVEPLARLSEPVELARIKKEKALAEFAMLRNGRLSVAPVTPAQFKALMKLAKTKLP
jgi:predicted RNA-binding protein with PUA-like domain